MRRREQAVWAYLDKITSKSSERQGREVPLPGPVLCVRFMGQDIEKVFPYFFPLQVIQL